MQSYWALLKARLDFFFSFLYIFYTQWCRMFNAIVFNG
jgi:hypothetical protein